MQQIDYRLLYEIGRRIQEVEERTNDNFIPLYHDESRFLVLKGGAGSGKSVFAVQKLLHRMTSERGHRFLVARKVHRTIWESCFALLRSLINEYYNPDDWKIASSRQDMKITYKPLKNEIIFAGLDDPEKIKSIFGITGIWLEEASEFDPADLRQLNLRLRDKSKHYRQIMLTFNPVSITHWLKTEFFDQKLPDVTTHESTYRDNRFIDEEYKLQLESYKEKDPYYYQVYCLGEWGVIGRTVLDPQKLTARLVELRKLNFDVGRFVLSETGTKFTQDINGAWTIFKNVQPERFYVAGVDVAEGAKKEGDTKADNHAAQILDNTTLEQVAGYHGNRDDPDQYAIELCNAGRYYNDALLCVEVNMESGVVRNLERMRYPKLYMRERKDTITHALEMKNGFRTTESTRRMMVSDLIEYVRDHSDKINCKKTIDEMLCFVRNEKGRPEAQSGKHDDLVIAYAIALQAAMSGQQHQSILSKRIDMKKLAKMSDDCQSDYWNAKREDREKLVEKWGLWIS